MGTAAERNCALHVLLAARSRRAVIFRRGPSRLTCLIAWDRADDSFEVGQWFKGSIYHDRSALSPDGTHLLAFLGKFRGPFGTFTVLSRPPYYTALALWPKGDTWGGGGQFLGDTAFVLWHGTSEHALAPGYAMPAGFTLIPHGPGREALIRRAAGEPGAWQVHEGADGTYATRTSTRRSERGGLLRARWHAEDVGRPWNGERRLDLVWRGSDVCLDGVRWADFDADGDLLFALGGRLHRCPEDALSRVGSSFAGLVEASRVLADFTDLRFRALLAPYRAGAPEPDGGEGEPDEFGPALDRVTREERRARKRGRMLARRGTARPA